MCMMPAAVSAQEPSSASKDVVRRIFAQHDDDSTRLRAFKTAIDTCSTMLDKEQLSYAFLDMSLARNSSAYNLVTAYMYAGYFASNNGNIHKALDLSFKALEITDSIDTPRMNLNKSNLLINISSFLTGISDYDGSFKYIQKAQEVAEKAEIYTDLVDIYYNIAISYIEQELYESAIQYFKKDIEAYLKAGYTNTIEQELTIESLRIKNALKNHDTTSAIQLIDYVNGLIGDVGRIEDVNGISNYCISMISSNIEATELRPEHRKEYLEHCNQYLEILRNAIDTADVLLLKKVAYNPYYASYLAVSGNTQKSWEILKDTSNFIGEEGYDMAMYEYCKAKKDFKDAYDYFWKIYSDKFKNHSLETAIHYEKSESRNAYEKRLLELQTIAKNRDKEFQESKQFNDTLSSISIVMLAIVVAIILVCLYYLRMRNRLNGQLRQSNEELIIANEELNTKRKEILSQTDEIQHQSGIIKAQRDNLGSTNSHLMNSINIARDIQAAVMVTSEKLSEVVGDNFIYWKPLNVVSGDFYWCTRIGRQSYLVVADCTGHGVPGALLSMYGISMLNDIIWRRPHSDAAEILDAMKASFVKSFVFDENEQYFLDGMDVALSIINRETMTIDYAGAKRPLVIVSGGTLTELKPDKISIGHNPMRKLESFTNHQLSIQKGDMVYAFSDGIPDQFGYDDGTTKFGSRQLKDLLTEISFFELSAQKKIIESVVENWRTGAFEAGISAIKTPQLDDQLLIGIRI